MTLESVPRYDPEQIDGRDGHAIVIGAGMAGLLAARVLADYYESVTVLDRDPLPEEPTIRRGVPQGAHPHVMLEAGRTTIEDLFPGYEAEFASAGGLVVDAATNFEFYSQDDFVEPVPDSMPMFCATRPLFELIVRRRLATRAGVEFRAPCQFVEYLVDDDAETVRAVAVRDDEGRKELVADLVVDATGRTTQTPVWLEARGYAPPPLDEVHVDIAYSTTTVERPPDDENLMIVPAVCPYTRGGMVFPVEDGRWIVNLQGVHDDQPPTEFDAFHEFAASLPMPEIRQVLDEHPRAADEIHHYRLPSTRRYRYETLERFPEGLVVLGDAIASFNPVYGQGMSVAALEALELHHALAEGRDDLALRFFDRASDITDVAWNLTVAVDFGFPQTEGAKPNVTDHFTEYFAEMIKAAHDDGHVTAALYRMLFLEQSPPSLLQSG